MNWDNAFFHYPLRVTCSITPYRYPNSIPLATLWLMQQGMYALQARYLVGRPCLHDGRPSALE